MPRASKDGHICEQPVPGVADDLNVLSTWHMHLRILNDGHLNSSINDHRCHVNKSVSLADSQDDCHPEKVNPLSLSLSS